MAGAYLSSPGHREGTNPGQALPPQGHSPTEPHSLGLGQYRHASSPDVQIFRMWEETRVPGQNPCRRGENVQMTGSFCLTHQHYNETMLNEMILLENLLYLQWQNHTTHPIHPLFCTDGSRKGHLLLKMWMLIKRHSKQQRKKKAKIFWNVCYL